MEGGGGGRQMRQGDERYNNGNGDSMEDGLENVLWEEGKEEILIWSPLLDLS